MVYIASLRSLISLLEQGRHMLVGVFHFSLQVGIMRYVYILRCADGTFYTGMTKDLERRAQEHNSGDLGAKYTKARRPVELVWNSESMTRNDAAKDEWRIKKLSKKQKTMMIILL